MNHKLDILNPLDHPDWDDLVRTGRGCSFFHTSHWARVIQESYAYRPLYFTRIENGALKVLVPVMEIKSFLTGRRGVSLPFTDYCEPLHSGDISWPDVMEQIKAYARTASWKYLEMRGGSDLLSNEPSSSVYYNHILNLSSDTDSLLSKLKNSTKRNIKKAQREGVSVARHASLDAVNELYRLHCETRKKHGAPPQPFYFFRNIHDHVIAHGHGIVVLASHQGKTIAAALYLHFGTEAIYKFGASCEKYLSLRPNDLVMWEAIQYYGMAGYSRFSFGRTDPDNSGLRQFKAGWGTEEKEIHYFTYDICKGRFISRKNPSLEISKRIFQRMPLPMLKGVGRALYRHVG